MVFDRAAITRLLGSIEANHLVIICGAGLSIPAPSNLMSAVNVARYCYDRWQPTETLPIALRDDIDELAGHFHAQGQFESVFISALVPWNALVGEPNIGHAAVADLLICRAANAALSANFDPLIEQWSERQKVAMQGALNGAEAAQFTASSSPLLKFHGCLHRGRSDTLWTRHQLGDPEIQARINSCAVWMAAHLPLKDLLIVGFWTDWGYLNDVLANAISLHGVSSITVIDPLSDVELQAKAPVLWQTITNAGVPFTHVQSSGTVALEELRIEFSRTWARKFFNLSIPFLAAEGVIYNPALVNPTAWSCDELYNLRRDAAGVPFDQAAFEKEPAREAASAAFAHVLLARAHATRTGSTYEHLGNTIRIVHGAGQMLETVKERYNEPPTVPTVDIVICAGATSVGVPARVISSGRGASVVRPARGGASRWLTLDQARAELAI